MTDTTLAALTGTRPAPLAFDCWDIFYQILVPPIRVVHRFGVYPFIQAGEARIQLGHAMVRI